MEKDNQNTGIYIFSKNTIRINILLLLFYYSFEHICKFTKHKITQTFTNNS